MLLKVNQKGLLTGFLRPTPKGVHPANRAGPSARRPRNRSGHGPKDETPGEAAEEPGIEAARPVRAVRFS